MTTRIIGGTGIEFPDATQQDTRGVPNNLAYAQGRISSDLTIPSAGYTLPFDVLQFDPSGMWDSVNNRLSPKVSGLYYVALTVMSSHTDQFAVVEDIRKNGTAAFRVQRNMHAGDSGLGLLTMTCSGLMLMNGTTDYIDFWVTPSGGSGNSTLHSGAPASGGSTKFSIYLVRAL